MLWGTLVNCCGEIILSNNKYSFNYGELIYLRNNLSFVKNIFGLLGFCFCSFALTNQSQATIIYSMNCEKSKSYILNEREVFNEKDDDVKKYPTKLITSFNQNKKSFLVSYDLHNGTATINGSKAFVSAPLKKNYDKEIYLGEVSFSGVDIGDNDLETFLEKNVDKKYDEVGSTYSTSRSFMNLHPYNFIAVQYFNRLDEYGDVEVLQDLISVTLGRCDSVKIKKN